MNRILFVFAAALALAVAVPLASADGPGRFDSPFPPEGVTSRACGFPVFIEAVRDTGFMLDFGDHFIVGGTLMLRYTNVATSQSIEVNSTGPVMGSLTEDGLGFVTRHEGHTTFFIGPLLAARLGIPQGLYVSSGLVIVSGTFAVGITSLDRVGGTWTNLCPLLA
jgi:hypothetical protein